MCIIAHGLKRNFPEPEFKECLKTNSSGVFLAVIRPQGGGRTVAETIRTLDNDEATRKFESLLPDDEIVLHARIPSRGGHTLDNVHGWKSEEGLYFCHNGTMSSIRTWEDHTDSETFFRRFFLPCWRGEGRKFTDNVEFLINQFIGGGKFCFVLPDGTVKLYGNYVKDHDMEFSNSSYKVYTPPPAVERQGWRNAASDRDLLPDDWEGEDDGWGGCYGGWSGCDYYGRTGRAGHTIATRTAKTPDLSQVAQVSAPVRPETSKADDKSKQKKAGKLAKAAKSGKPDAESVNDAVDAARDLDDRATAKTAAQILRDFVDHHVTLSYLMNCGTKQMDGVLHPKGVSDALDTMIGALLEGTMVDLSPDEQLESTTKFLLAFADETRKTKDPVSAAAALVSDYLTWICDCDYSRNDLPTTYGELADNVRAVQVLCGIGTCIESGYFSGHRYRIAASRFANYGQKTAMWAKTADVSPRLLVADVLDDKADCALITTALNQLADVIVSLEAEK